MLQQFVEAAIEGMYLHQTIIGAQQITIALCSNHIRCKRQSLPGSIRR
jgi:hypothetical protein